MTRFRHGAKRVADPPQQTRSCGAQHEESGLWLLTRWKMHELPVTQGILAVVLEAARQTGARRITAIDLVVGEFSSIVDDCVQFYFDILSRETLAEGATLRFQREPAITTCRNCGRQTRVRVPLLPWCPACGSAHLCVTGGREFYVESMEVAYEDSGGERDPQCERSGGA